MLALAKRDYGEDASATDTGISARAWIGSTSLGLSLEITGKHRTIVSHGYRRPDPALPANTPLVLRVKPGFDREIGDTWQDEDGHRLESRIAEIAAALIVAGEAKFRQHLREDEERAEQARVERERKEEEARRERERRRLARIRELNEQRVTDLRTSGELPRAARDLRTLVAEVREAMQDRLDVDSETLDAWASWALQEADALDPILSGQVLKHLRPKTDHRRFEPDGPPACCQIPCSGLRIHYSPQQGIWSLASGIAGVSRLQTQPRGTDFPQFPCKIPCGQGKLDMRRVRSRLRRAPNSLAGNRFLPTGRPLS